MSSLGVKLRSVICAHIDCVTNKLENEVRHQRTFCFPLNDERRRQWLNLLNRPDLLTLTARQSFNRGFRVCWLHFKDSQFQTPEKKKLNHNQNPIAVLPTVAEPESDINDATEITTNIQELAPDTEKTHSTSTDSPPTESQRKVAEPELDIADAEEIPTNCQKPPPGTETTDPTPTDPPPTERQRKGRKLASREVKMTPYERRLHFRLRTAERLLALSKKIVLRAKRRKIQQDDF